MASTSIKGIAIFLVFVALLALWQSFLYRQSGGRLRSPLWGAFTATAASILFIVAGAVGYKLTHGVPFTNRSEWTGQVLWSQIAVGGVAAIVAVFLWRAGLRSIRTGSGGPGSSRPGRHAG